MGSDLLQLISSSPGGEQACSFGERPCLEHILIYVARTGYYDEVDAVVHACGGSARSCFEGTSPQHDLPQGKPAPSGRAMWADDELRSHLLSLRHGRLERTRLMAAAACGDASRLAQLLCAPAGVRAHLSVEDVDGDTALHWAVSEGRIAAVRMLLEAGADIEANDAERYTPLHWAAQKGHTAVVQALLDAGAAVDAVDGCGCTPLIAAASEGHVGSMMALLAQGAAIDAVDELGTTALAWATRQGLKGCVLALLEGGATVDCRGAEGFTPLIIASLQANVDVINVLLAHGAATDATEPHTRMAPLHFAASQRTPHSVWRGTPPTGDSAAAICALVAAGADVEAEAEDGQRPLHMAAQRCNVEGIRTLLAANATRAAVTRSGRSVLDELKRGWWTQKSLSLFDELARELGGP